MVEWLKCSHQQATLILYFYYIAFFKDDQWVARHVERAHFNRTRGTARQARGPSRALKAWEMDQSTTHENACNKHTSLVG